MSGERAEPVVSDSEVERRDRMWGAGNWIVHEDCPAAAIAGQDRAVHHKDFHRG